MFSARGLRTWIVFWHPHHSLPATASILVMGEVAEPTVRVYGCSVSQRPSVSKETKGEKNILQTIIFCKAFSSSFQTIFFGFEVNVAHAKYYLLYYFLWTRYTLNRSCVKPQISFNYLIIPASLLYTMRSPFTREANTLLSKYLQKKI